MATKNLNDLHKVMSLMGEAFYFAKEITADDLSETTDLLSKADFMMPLGDDGVNFEIGDPSITRKKITEGRTWVSYAKRGDDNITFQVPSLDESIAGLFMNEKTAAAVKAKLGTADTLSGKGYSLAPKKVVGSWLFRDPEHTIAVILPATENYGTFKGATGDKEAYFNVSTVPLANSANVELYILHKGAQA